MSIKLAANPRYLCISTAESVRKFNPIAGRELRILNGAGFDLLIEQSPAFRSRLRAISTLLSLLVAPPDARIA